jgi:NAD(P)-dependent dehydrogenase (short-subunit alcohol dehydrogenase family)
MEKKTIVITGSTKGIGYGLATEFLKAGHQVVINGRSVVRLAQAVAELNKINSSIAGLTGNVNDPETHVKLTEKAVNTFGKIDIWINNAGISQPHRWFRDIEDEDMRNILEINVYGMMLGTKTATNFMMKQGFGKIFNMEGFGSDGRMMDKLTLYGTTKRAVNYFTKSVSKEMKESPVQIGILSPGMVRTDFLIDSKNERTPEEAKQFKKVYDLLAEDRDVVTKFLAARVLKSTKNYDRINFLTKGKLIGKLIRMMF